MVSVFSANEETISRVNKYGLLEEQHCDPEEIDRNSHGTGMPGIRVSWKNLVARRQEDWDSCENPHKARIIISRIQFSTDSKMVWHDVLT